MKNQRNVLILMLMFTLFVCNLLAVAPITTFAAEALMLSEEIADFEGDATQVKKSFGSYQSTGVSFKIGNYGTNGTSGAYLSTTTNADHRFVGKDRYPVKKGKTYYLSTWVKTDTANTGLAMHLYFRGYHIDGKINGQAVTKTSGYYPAPSKMAMIGEWSRLAVSVQIDKVYRQYKVDGTAYYVEVPVNEDGTFQAGKVSTDGVFTPTEPADTMRFEGFIAFGLYENGKWSNQKQANPTRIYADNWYVVEEDSATSVNYAKATVANVEIENEEGDASAEIGTVLTASAAIANGNLKAKTTLSWQWQSSADGVDYSDISGATGSTYTVTKGDAEQYLRAVATASSTGTVNGTTSMSGVSNAVLIPEAPVETFDIFIEVGQGGKVTVGEEICEGPETKVITLEENDSVTLTVTANDGYEVDKILIDEQEYSLNGNTLLLEQISKDMEVQISFREQVTQPSISGTNANYIVADPDYEKGYSMVAYYKLTLPKDYSLGSYGMYIGLKDGDVQKLEALGHANGCFGIRVYGKAITSENQYTFRGFANMSLNGEEQEYLTESVIK